MLNTRTILHLIRMGITAIAALFICAIITLILGSCRTHEVIQEVPIEVPHYIHDTLRITQKEKELVYITDSTFTRGDTVFKYRDRWRTLVTHDTLYQSHRDTIGIPTYIARSETKAVAKPLAWWQSALMGIGSITSLALFFGLLTWFIRKRMGV